MSLAAGISWHKNMYNSSSLDLQRDNKHAYMIIHNDYPIIILMVSARMTFLFRQKLLICNFLNLVLIITM